MLHQILTAGEARASAALAVLVRAHAAGFGAAVLVVDLALVAVEAAGIGEAAVLAARLFAGVGSSMLVHVFTAMVSIG